MSIKLNGPVPAPVMLPQEPAPAMPATAQKPVVKLTGPGLKALDQVHAAPTPVSQ